VTGSRPFRRTLGVAVAALVLLAVLVPAANPMSAGTKGSPRMIAPNGARVLEFFLPSPGVGTIAYVGSTRLPSGRVLRLPPGALVTLQCATGCSRTQRITVGPSGLVERSSRLFTGVVVRSGTTIVAKVTKPGWVGYYEKFAARPALKGSTPLCLPPASTGPQKPQACQHTLTVRTFGTGGGHIRGAAIHCPGSCSAKLGLEAQATLTAIPSAGSTFGGWSGSGCGGIGVCTVTMSQDQKVTAVFVPAGSYAIAFQSGSGKLAGYPSATGPKVRAGTSPSIAAYEIAFQTPKGSLEIYSVATRQTTTTGQTMEAGTSPSIAALTGGGYAVAFQTGTGFLDVYSSATHGVTKTGLAMKTGTSPSVAALRGGAYAVAFQASTGVFSVYDSKTRQTTTTTLGMRAGTSPSIAALRKGSYEAAFQTNAGHLYLYSSQTHQPTDTHLGMKAGASPSIAGLTIGDFVVAFQANTGLLFTYSSATPHVTKTALAMAPGTSPCIAGLAGGNYEIAFQADTGLLSTYSPAAQQPTTQDLSAGTSPSIEGF